LAAAPSIEKVIEDRLREIEAQLSELRGLEHEQERLTRALDALRSGTNGPKATATRRRSRSAGPRSGARTSTRRRRAKRGSNQTAILSHIEKNPGTTTPEIADATGIGRPVVYSAVSRLASTGRVVKDKRDDGQVSYRLSAR
jgi:Winged helix-turn-helix DNA-binding